MSSSTSTVPSKNITPQRNDCPCLLHSQSHIFLLFSQPTSSTNEHRRRRHNTIAHVSDSTLRLRDCTRHRIKLHFPSTSDTSSSIICFDYIPVVEPIQIQTHTHTHTHTFDSESTRNLFFSIFFFLFLQKLNFSSIFFKFMIHCPAAATKIDHIYHISSLHVCLFINALTRTYQHDRMSSVIDIHMVILTIHIYIYIYTLCPHFLYPSLSCHIYYIFTQANRGHTSASVSIQMSILSVSTSKKKKN